MSTDSNNLATARAQMMYDANRKSTGVAYLLAIFLGGLGAHRFYLGYPGTAAVQLVLWVLGWPTAGLFWIPLGIWILIDLFLIPGMARQKNMAIAEKFAE
ncbi:TM2 domain-containing protein [Qipengyuania flava]|nr:TM2 domain-containing protein [Qipengyuania flava]